MTSEQADDATQSTGARTIACAAAALVALALALVFAVPKHDDSTEGVATCGSALLPVDTSSECIDTRDRAALVSSGLAVVAVVLGVFTLAGLPRDARGASDPGSRTARIALRSGGAAALVSAIVAFAVPVDAGDRDCGMVKVSTSEAPVDEFGNVDAACVDAYQRRWVVIAVLLAAAITLLLGSTRVLTGRASRSRIAGWIGVACVSGSLVLGLLLFTEHLLAPRGGA